MKVSRGFTISGIGSGPTLTMKQLVAMLEAEVELPELESTTLPGTLPQRVRKACYLAAAIVLPIVVLAGVLDLAFVSDVVRYGGRCVKMLY